MTKTQSRANTPAGSDQERPDAVVIFAPLPVLTVTVEDRSGEADIHVHAGGQGVWQSRMVSSLGVPVVLCAALGGETGDVLNHLLPIEDVTARIVPVSARNGSYVHDRRTGTREVVAESPGSPLDRHELDSLYELTLTEGLEHGWVLLSGPQEDDVLPADLYRRLATDLGANGCKVAADLSGERLEAVLAGNPSLIKVSHEELLDDGQAKSDDAEDLVKAMRAMREECAGTIVVSRSGAAPALALLDGSAAKADVVEIEMPKLEPADPAGAGDSMTAGMVAALAGGRSIREALQIGAACGALNVVRHGLGTGGARAVETLAERVELRPWK
ncbi:1-phosphofructokinase [Mycolicibacterium chitae]|uniref:Ribokinase-like domain-containing protein n=1 Tax=Mycolicibacterium chitae TaxID=1792 RepID=A0A448IEE7_MYCCI|nr:PfkB family carbohydrate kinase [Mycolicibacterium chitae]MCV7104722.1 phosphofructokinase [Mycolicibacterium chitae]BBZ01927.1 1-phosphofructokinase [Mycolicibacterium chitae]VEG50754.1 ribokinase-like domain-containing protein [Mycolicibacterium chitae]